MDKINLKAVLLQNMGEDSADFLPIMGDEKELLNDNMQIPDTLPILPLRNTVLFPGVIIPINIGRNHHSHHSRQEKVFIGRYPLRRSLPCWEDQFEKRRRGT